MHDSESEVHVAGREVVSDQFRPTTRSDWKLVRLGADELAGEETGLRTQNRRLC